VSVCRNVGLLTARRFWNYSEKVKSEGKDGVVFTMGQMLLSGCLLLYIHVPRKNTTHNGSDHCVKLH
jgi:hypothetical protein